MADSYWTGTAGGTTAVYSVPFPYIAQTDVNVELNGVPMLTPGDYEWTNASTITFNTVPPGGTTVSITRNTSPDTLLVSFNNGAILTASDLNTVALQCFYRTQELQDQLNVYIGAGVARYSVTGTNPFVTPQDLLNAAADAALQTTLAQELLSATASITTNAQSILTNTNQISTLQATLDNLTSSIPAGIGTYLTNETNSRISGDQALAGTLALIGAVSNGGATFVLNTANVYVDASTSMADKFAGLLSEIAGNSASVTSEATTRASADSALASSITSLTSTVGGNTASIASQATSIDGLQAQYAVKIDNNGHVSGFGLASGVGGTSTFTVVANDFSVIDPGNGSTGPTVPFTISGGVCFMQNVVIGGALIEDATIVGAKLVAATIGTAQIANAAITSALIGTAAIESANIANLAVTNAHIANLSVDTNQLVDNAVTHDLTYTQSGTYTKAGLGTATAVTQTYASDGGRLLIMVRANLTSIVPRGLGASYVAYATLAFEVDGVTYDTFEVSTLSGASGSGTNATTIGINTFVVLQLTSGNHTVSLVVTDSESSGNGSSSATVDSTNLAIIEFLK